MSPRFVFAFIAVLIDMLALGAIVPVLPKLVLQFQGGDAAAGARWYGFLETTWAGMQFLAMPLVGTLSDRFGRRRIVQLSSAGLALDYALMALAPSLPLVFLGRIVSGLTSSTYPTAFAYISDVTPAEERSRKFGLLGAAFGLAFIIGPAAGGILGGINLRYPFWLASMLCLTNVLFSMLVMPESLPAERRSRKLDLSRANPIGALLFLKSHAELLALAVTGFLYRVAHDVMPALFVIYGSYRYHWGSRTVGTILATVGLITTIAQAGLIGPAVKRLGERKALLVGLGSGAVAFWVYGLAASGEVFLGAIPIGALFGLSYPALQGLMSRRVGPSEQGRLQGANASLTGVAGMVAPVMFTQIFALAIGPFVHLDMPGLPFFVAAVLLLLGGFLASRAIRHAPA